MASFNMRLFVEVVGFAADRLDDARAAVRVFLEDEGLWGDFFDDGTRSVVRTMTGVDGRAYVVAATPRPVVVKNPDDWDVGERFVAAMTDRLGPAVAARLRMWDADGDVAEQVEAALRAGWAVGGQATRQLGALMPALAALRDELPTWEQREALLYLVAERRDVPEAWWREGLGAPGLRDFTRATLLAALDGRRRPREAWLAEPELAGRLADRVAREGLSFAEALHREGSSIVGGPLRSVLGRGSPWADAAGASAKRSTFGAPITRVRGEDVLRPAALPGADAYAAWLQARGARDVVRTARALLVRHPGARAAIGAGEAGAEVEDDGVVVFCFGPDVWTPAARALHDDAAWVEATLPEAIAEVDRELALVASDPLFSQPIRELLRSLGKATPGETWARLARHPAARVRREVASAAGAPLEALVALARDPSQAVRVRVAERRGLAAAVFDAMTDEASDEVRLAAIDNPACPAALAARWRRGAVV